MSNLSITICSFCLKKKNSIGYKKAYYLNRDIKVKNIEGVEKSFNNAFYIVKEFFEANKELENDKENQKAFQSLYYDKAINSSNFVMYPIIIKSGMYGNESDIININSKKMKYKKEKDDVDLKSFNFIIAIPKDNDSVVVQRGIFIFQNIGQYGIKTITTQRMQDFLAKNYDITLVCNTIAPTVFVEKLLNPNTIQKISLIKYIKSSDDLDNYELGYGEETKILGKLNFSSANFNKLKNRLLIFSGSKNNLFEFDEVLYNNVKVQLDINGTSRSVSLHNLDKLSIIESLPDEIKGENGNADQTKLIKYLDSLIDEYLENMTLSVK